MNDREALIDMTRRWLDAEERVIKNRVDVVALKQRLQRGERVEVLEDIERVARQWMLWTVIGRLDWKPDRGVFDPDADYWPGFVDCADRLLAARDELEEKLGKERAEVADLRAHVHELEENLGKERARGIEDRRRLREFVDVVEEAYAALYTSDEARDVRFGDGVERVANDLVLNLRQITAAVPGEGSLWERVSALISGSER